MRRISLIFALTFVLQTMALAQGIGVFPSEPSQNIGFIAISNAPSENLPSGTVFYSPLVFSPDTGFSTNVLEVEVDVGSISNTDGWILQMKNDGSLTPIIELSIEPDYGGTIGTYPGIPPSSYTDFVSVQLTDAQVQNFLAGQLYAQIDFGSDSYLGQLFPVPEPTSPGLIFCGIIFFALSNRIKPCNRFEKHFLSSVP
jgi:hypothetical protein